MMRRVSTWAVAGALALAAWTPVSAQAATMDPGTAPASSISERRVELTQSQIRFHGRFQAFTGSPRVNAPALSGGLGVAGLPYHSFGPSNCPSPVPYYGSYVRTYTPYGGYRYGGVGYSTYYGGYALEPAPYLPGYPGSYPVYGPVILPGGGLYVTPTR